MAVAELRANDAPRQGLLFAGRKEAPQRPDQLLQALDAIRDRHGDQAIRHGDAGRDAGQAEGGEDDLYGPSR